jgi:regulatory protein
MDRDSQTFRGAKQEAYRYLRGRNRTAREMRERLKRKGYTAEIITAVLHDLEADGYVNDRKLALEWARYRLQHKPMGRRRLAWELRGRGVDAEVLAEVLGTVYGELDEVALAEQVARKRLRLTSAAGTRREGQRLSRALFTLGFDLDVIAQVLATISHDAAPLDVGDGTGEFEPFDRA